MSKAQIIGVKRLDYTNKAGREVKGYSVHYGEKQEDMEGLAVANAYFNDEAFAKLLSYVAGDIKKLVNRAVDIEYNRYGRIDSIALVSSVN